MSDPAPGLYRHYKGNLYEVIGTATHSENGERLVVYRPCYGERALWVRPLAMFCEQVDTPAGRVQRFDPIAKSGVGSDSRNETQS